MRRALVGTRRCGRARNRRVQIGANEGPVPTRSSPYNGWLFRNELIGGRKQSHTMECILRSGSMKILSVGLEQACMPDSGCGLGPARHLELFENVVDVVLDRADFDPKTR